MAGEYGFRAGGVRIADDLRRDLQELTSVTDGAIEAAPRGLQFSTKALDAAWLRLEESLASPANHARIVIHSGVPPQSAISAQSAVGASGGGSRLGPGGTTEVVRISPWSQDKARSGGVFAAASDLMKARLRETRAKEAADIAAALEKTRDRFGGDGRDTIAAFLRAMVERGHDAWALKGLADAVEAARGP